MLGFERPRVYSPVRESVKKRVSLTLIKRATQVERKLFIRGETIKTKLLFLSTLLFLIACSLIVPVLSAACSVCFVTLLVGWRRCMALGVWRAGPWPKSNGSTKNTFARVCSFIRWDDAFRFGLCPLRKKQFASRSHERPKERLNWSKPEPRWKPPKLRGRIQTLW